MSKPVCIFEYVVASRVRIICVCIAEPGPIRCRNYFHRSSLVSYKNRIELRNINKNEFDPLNENKTTSESRITCNIRAKGIGLLLEMKKTLISWRRMSHISKLATQRIRFISKINTKKWSVCVVRLIRSRRRCRRRWMNEKGNKNCAWVALINLWAESFERLSWTPQWVRSDCDCIRFSVERRPNPTRPFPRWVVLVRREISLMRIELKCRPATTTHPIPKSKWNHISRQRS